MSVGSVGPDETVGDGLTDRLRDWSVVIVGIALGGVSIAGTVVGGGTEGATSHVVVPLVASAAIVGAGGWLRRTTLASDDVAVVAVWIVTTAGLFGGVVLTAAFVMADEPLAVGGYVATFMAPLGAGGGAVAGYSDARRRQQHRVTRRTQRALETASDGIAILDDCEEFVTVNQSHADIYGYDDPDELIGESWRTCYTDEAVARIEREVRPSLADRGEWRGEATGKRADGSTFPQELTLTLMDDGGVVCVVRDVTDRREQDRRITEQKQRLRTIVENVPVVLFAFDPDGTITLSEGKSLDALGLEPGEAVGASMFDLYADTPEIVDACERALEGESVHRTAEIGPTVLEAWMTPVLDADGSVSQVIGAAMNVTDEHEQSRQLREQKRRLELIVENVPVALYAFEPDGTMTLSEGKGLESLGIEPGEIVGDSVFDLYADAPDVVEACRRAVGGDRVHTYAEIGSAVFELWMVPIVEDGSVSQVIGTSMDVTETHERRRQIAALHEASRQLTYATTSDEVAGTAVEIVGETLDRTLSAFWRYDDERDRLEPVSVNDAMRSRASDADVTIDPLGDETIAMECFRSGELTVIEDYSRIDRPAVPRLALGTVILVPIGDHGLLQAGHEDVTGLGDTERTQLEILQLNLQAALDRVERNRLLRGRTEELELRTSQMEFINSILRHDILNGMTVIRARAEFLESDLEGQHGEYADTIVRWCDDINDFVERVQIVLNALSGSEDIGVKPVEATELLTGELERLRQTYPEISFEASLPAKSWVRANDLLSDVLGNLVRNAVEHNDSAGLEVCVSVEASAETTTVRVADNGRGIPPDERERVFRRGETHAKSAGSGFGLFFVDAMVDAYGGEIRIEDNDPGAVFVLELPAASPAESPKSNTR